MHAVRSSKPIQLVQSHTLPLNMQAFSPKGFIWTGPDPPHHFSIAVRTAAHKVRCKALTSVYR